MLRFRQCAAISAADGRWRATNCSAALPTACRTRGSGDWLLTRPGLPGGCEALASGAAFELPRHAKENLALAETLRAARPPIDAAWLPLTGDADHAQEGDACRVPPDDVFYSSSCVFWRRVCGALQLTIRDCSQDLHVAGIWLTAAPCGCAGPGWEVPPRAEAARIA